MLFDADIKESVMYLYLYLYLNLFIHGTLSGEAWSSKGPCLW